MNKQLAIQTNNLSRHFGTIRAVDQITFEVPKGIVFGFLGPNGSGKTTTIRLLLGLLEPTNGQAKVMGYNVRTEADMIRQHTGAMLEHNGLYERLSAEENLEFYGRVFRMEKTERQARIKELLTHFGLWERRDEKIGNWSKGMRQKVVIARTLLHQPEIIFLDEPTSGLDPLVAVSIRDDLSRLVNQEGTTVFLNTHNLPEAEKLCKQVGIIDEGKLLAVGNLETLQNQSTGMSLKIHGSGFTKPTLDLLQAQFNTNAVTQNNGSLKVDFEKEVEVSQVVNLLVNQGAKIEEVQKHKTSLEDLFVKLVKENDHVN